MPRATPLPPDERRAAIVRATVPLLLAVGPSVSTREIAEAAGVAEGTLFRVFPTKEAIVDAVIADAIDPTIWREQLEAVDRGLPLDVRVAQAMTVLESRDRRIFSLFRAIGFRPKPDRAGEQARHEHRDILIAAVADVLAPDADQLRIPVLDAVHLLHAMVMATTHPMLRDSIDFDAAALTDLLLHGISYPDVVPAAAELEGSAC